LRALAGFLRRAPDQWGGDALLVIDKVITKAAFDA
jgi:hypothetical protein